MRYFLMLGWLVSGLCLARPTPVDSLLPVQSRTLRPGTTIAFVQPGGLLLAGQTKAGAFVQLTDSAGSVRWQQTYPSLLAMDVSRQRMALVGMGASSGLMLTLGDLANRGQTRHTLDLPEGSQPDVAFQADGSVVVAAYTDAGISLWQILPDGQEGWSRTMGLPDSVASVAQPLNLLTLPDGGLVLSVGQTVLGLDKAGKRRWLFSGGQDQVQWTRLKRLSNGQVVLLGQGIAAAFSPDNADGRVLTIDPVTGKHGWLKILGSYGTKEAAIDAWEDRDATLLVLVQGPAGARLFRINARQEARPAGTLRPGSVGQQYVNLLSLGNGQFGALLANPKTGQAMLQTWGNTAPTPAPVVPTPGPQPSTTRPALYGLAVGVPYPPLQFSGADAGAVARALEREQGRAFQKVTMQLLNTPDRATITQIGAAVERWSLTLKPQPDDWVLVFVSGLAIDLHHDFRLIGADYDPAAPRSTSLSLRTLLRDLNALPCRKLILLDVGHPQGNSMPYTPRANDSQTFSFAPRDFPNTYVLLASQPDQRAYEDASWQHGAFTRALLDGLTGPADSNRNGQLYLNELYAYLSETVPALVRSQKQKLQQPTWLIRQKDDPVLLEN